MAWFDSTACKDESALNVLDLKLLIAAALLLGLLAFTQFLVRRGNVEWSRLAQQFEYRPFEAFLRNCSR